MKHYGDITKLSGYEIEPVDVVTGGSPCQDLSVAGKRAGLEGERSGLFMEQIRIVKELRERDRLSGRTGIFIRPRYMVWENVPGAFSSGSPKGADFAAVIEEIIKVAELGANIDVRIPDRGWTRAGCYYAEDGTWSVAWRVHDAQFWGVPQRRRRIALVADFGGLSAPEILFVRKGMSGDIEQSKQERKETARAAGEGSASDDRTGTLCYAIDKAIITSGNCTAGGPCVSEECAPTLTTDRPHAVAYSFDSLASNSMKSKNPYSGCRQADVAKTLDTTDPNPCKNQGGIAIVEPMPYTLKIRSGCEGGGKSGANSYEDGSPILTYTHGGEPAIAYTYDARGNGVGSTASTLTGDHESRITDYTSVVVEERPGNCLQGAGATSQNS